MSDVPQRPQKTMVGCERCARCDVIEPSGPPHEVGSEALGGECLRTGRAHAPLWLWPHFTSDIALLEHHDVQTAARMERDHITVVERKAYMELDKSWPNQLL